MKKKFVTLFLTAALAVSMITGCGGDEAEPAAAAGTETEEPAEEVAEEAEEEAEEETADTSSSTGDFSLLDVDENMVDVGAYGTDSDGLELVFTMFTGPDSNKYVSLFGFDNNNNNGYVICGQYESSTEKDEDGDEWTYFDVSDVYSGQHFNLGVFERPETEQIAFFDKEGNVVEGKFLTNAETINYMGSAVALLTGDAGTDSSDSASDVKYVDGFYANNGSGDDFMIFFYESSDGDVAYVNDGTTEAFAEYTVEKAQLDDGTEYLLVTVGNVQLGYYEEGDDIYMISEDGDVYAAGRLSEEEAEALHSVVTEQ